MRVGHLVRKRTLVSDWVGSIIKRAVGLVGTPLLGIVTAKAGILGARYTIVHLTRRIVGIDVIRKSNTRRRRTRKVLDHVE